LILSVSGKSAGLCRFLDSDILECMKKQNATVGKAGGELTPGRIKKLIVGPLSRRMERHAADSRRVGQRVLRKLRAVEESVEILAREAASSAKHRR